MIQLFFPSIDSIPKYVNKSFSKHYDYSQVQPMLDCGYSVTDIEKELGYKDGYVSVLIQNHKVILPPDYKKNILNHKPIIRLSKTGEYMGRYNTKMEADRAGFKYGTITRVLNKKQCFAYDSCWFFEDDYISGNFTLPIEKEDHYTLPVEKYDSNNNIIAIYKSIYAAEKDSISNRSEIYRVASGDRKSSHKEIWKFAS